MNKIKHNPLFDTAKVEQIYSEKDGVDVKYVCTTDLRASDVPVDVFYRPTPHPEFGNRYFGIYHDHFRGQTMITNADIVEDLEFGLVRGDDQLLHYSESHHKYKMFQNGNMIDGGRQYIRSNGSAKVYSIKDGDFIKKHLTDEPEYVYPGKDCQV